MASRIPILYSSLWVFYWKFFIYLNEKDCSEVFSGCVGVSLVDKTDRTQFSYSFTNNIQFLAFLFIIKFLSLPSITPKRISKSFKLFFNSFSHSSIDKVLLISYKSILFIIRVLWLFHIVYPRIKYLIPF